MNKAVNCRLKVMLCHNNKFVKLCEQQNKPRKYEQKKIHQQIVHNCSTYTLSDDQYEALPFGLDTHIAVKANKNAIYAEFEVSLQSLLRDISNNSEKELRQTKTSLRNMCDKYTKIKVPYKYRKVVKELSERRDTAILKADKGRGIVIMNRDKYTEKMFTNA